MGNDYASTDPIYLQYEFTAYLQKAVRRHRAKYIAAQMRQKSIFVVLDAPEAIQGYSTSGNQLLWEDGDAISLLKSFSQRERQIVYLKIFSDCTFAQIAQRLMLPINTVKTTYYRAVQRLRTILENIEDI